MSWISGLLETRKLNGFELITLFFYSKNKKAESYFDNGGKQPL